jgi:hypothetical protein
MGQLWPETLPYPQQQKGDAPQTLRSRAFDLGPNQQNPGLRHLQNPQMVI